jgi:hypothetical protein
MQVPQNDGLGKARFIVRHAETAAVRKVDDIAEQRVWCSQGSSGTSVRKKFTDF